MNRILLIISREYLLRVRKKSFIFVTILMPIFIIGLMIAPALIQNIAPEEFKPVTVIDLTGRLHDNLSKTTSLPYVFTDKSLDELRADTSVDNILVIGPNAITDPTDIRFYSRGNMRLDAQVIMYDNLKSAIEASRMQDSGIDDIESIMAGISADNISVTTYTIDENGDNESESDVESGMIIGLLMAFVLYMFILIYGQIVMHSVIDEKANRVLELIVTSIKPTQLMLGKILGIGAVALTQVLIWVALIVSASAFLLPALAQTYPSLLAITSTIGSLSYVSSVMGYMAIYIFGGFMLYASIYAAIGASVDNAQDGSQLQTFAIVPVIVALIFATNVATNPYSQLAVWLSIIPFTSPMTMMARIPSGVPTVEIIASIGLLAITIAIFIWLTAKIYRVGIFMYGKKPTIREILRWTRQK